MKIAIHSSKWGFSSDWIAYCEANGVPYKIVDCYASDIIAQVSDCDILLWHHHHTLAKDKLFAQQLLFALEHAGKTVFPEFNSGWHFDDKVGQKYLLEAIGAPLVPTEVFYSKPTAMNWIDSATFPTVFKLRGGAGSSNVKLVRSKAEARKYVRKAFGNGFPSYDKLGNLREVLRKFFLGKSPFRHVMLSIRRLFMSTEFARVHGAEKGYVLFQKFIPNNAFDIRIIVIGERAFGIKRMVRQNDFRASGSGSFKYAKEEIDIRSVQIAFDVAKRLDALCVAYDFVYDVDNSPLIVEINYGFAKEGYYDCPGYWTRDMQWHETSFNSPEFIVEELLKRNQ